MSELVKYDTKTEVRNSKSKFDFYKFLKIENGQFFHAYIFLIFAS